MTAVVLPVYALLPARFESYLRLVSAPAHNEEEKKRSQINNKSLIKAGFQRVAQGNVATGWKKNNLHWDQPLWVWLFDNGSAPGSTGWGFTGSQPPARPPGSRSVCACMYIWIGMTSERSLRRRGNVSVHRSLTLFVVWGQARTEKTLGSVLLHSPANADVNKSDMPARLSIRHISSRLFLHGDALCLNPTIWAPRWSLSNVEHWRETGSNLLQAFHRQFAPEQF